MKNYSDQITNAPQSKPIFGRSDMVKNDAGGFVFEITPKQLLERFLLIGSEGGTYYVSEQKLTEDNAKKIVEMIKVDGLTVVGTVIDVMTNNRAPKTDASLFVLALAATYGNAITKKAAYDAVSKVTKTSTHLFMFLANIQNLRGWSNGLRKAVAKFYTTRTNDQIAYQMTKYRNRAGFTHADALRLSHPKAKDEQQNALFKYAVGKDAEKQVDHPLVQSFERAQTASDKDLLAIIAEGKLTWEMIPTEKLNAKGVLEALLPNMPLTALIRNLNRFAYNDLTDSNNPVTKAIVAKLTDEEAIKKSGLHPLNVVNSMLTYSSGHGKLGGKTWKPNQNIVDALAETYEFALKAIVPTGKNILIGVDISGSMKAEVGGFAMNCSQVANILAVTMLKSEKNAELVWFDTVLKKPTIGKRNSVDEVLRMSPTGGGTDCAQPLVHASNTMNHYDAIIILTDTETWAGPRHGLDVLNSYRKNVNKNVKVIEVALEGRGESTMPSDDPNVLRVVGFDASVIQIINKYLE